MALSYLSEMFAMYMYISSIYHRQGGDTTALLHTSGNICIQVAIKVATYVYEWQYKGNTSGNICIQVAIQVAIKCCHLYCFKVWPRVLFQNGKCCHLHCFNMISLTMIHTSIFRISHSYMTIQVAAMRFVRAFPDGDIYTCICRMPHSHVTHAYMTHSYGTPSIGDIYMYMPNVSVI